MLNPLCVAFLRRRVSDLQSAEFIAGISQQRRDGCTLPVLPALVVLFDDISRCFNHLNDIALALKARSGQIATTLLTSAFTVIDAVIFMVVVPVVVITELEGKRHHPFCQATQGRVTVRSRAQWLRVRQVLMDPASR